MTISIIMIIMKALTHLFEVSGFFFILIILKLLIIFFVNNFNIIDIIVLFLICCASGFFEILCPSLWVLHSARILCALCVYTELLYCMLSLVNLFILFNESTCYKKLFLVGSLNVEKVMFFVEYNCTNISL